METSKRSIRLTPRLDLVKRMAQGKRNIVDIGCDHGRLSVALLQADGKRHVTATDISPVSAQKAERLRDKCGFSSSMDVYTADGFLPEYKVAPDCAVIAGMGGMLIADIISRGMDICTKLDMIIMQPMRGVEELRRFLYDQNFCALNDVLVEDSGRIYQVLSFRYTGIKEVFPDSYPNDWFEFGHTMFKNRDPLLYRALQNRRRELEEALSHAVSSGKRQDIDEGIEFLRTRLNKTDQAIDYLLSIQAVD